MFFIVVYMHIFRNLYYGSYSTFLSGGFFELDNMSLLVAALWEEQRGARWCEEACKP